MAAHRDREHYIPLRRTDLIELLAGQCDPGEAALFRRLCQLLTDRVHVEFYRLFDKLKDDYSPFDPDADTKALDSPDPAARIARADRLFLAFDRLLRRANFRKLTEEEILACQAGSSPWGLNMSIDLAAFERFAMYVRGKTVGTRVLRSWATWFRKKQFSTEMYQRLVIILKQRHHRRLGKDPDVRSVFLKLFKDIPVNDVEMLIPGGRLTMPTIERGKLGLSLLSGLVVLLWQFLKPLFVIAKAAAGGAVAFGPFGLVAALFGYGYRQYYGYQFSLKTYNLQLAQSLYYQNLDNNAGVLFRLLDAAEEQECRETILAYFYLLRSGPQTEKHLDDTIEIELERLAGIKVDFEIDDALRKIERIGLGHDVDGVWSAVPLTDALNRLAELPAEPVFAREVLDDNPVLDIAADFGDRNVRDSQGLRIGEGPP